MPRYHLTKKVNWSGLMRTLRWSIKHEFFVFRDHYDLLLQALKLAKAADVRIQFIAFSGLQDRYRFFSWFDFD